MGDSDTVPDGHLQFPSAAIRRHADSVDEIADAMRTARGAVHEVTLDAQAYGRLCQFLPAVLSPVFTLAAGALNDAEDALRETSGKLRSTVSATTAADESAGRRVRASGAPLPELPL